MFPARKLIIHSLIFLLTFVFLWSLVFLNRPIHASNSNIVGKNEIVEVIRNINISKIMLHTKYFSSLESRYSGYSGCDAAAEYIRQYFQNLGLVDVEFHEFNVTVPIDYGASISLLGHDGKEKWVLKAYTLEPNMVQLSLRSHEGLTGKLVYVGKGYLEEMSKKEIEDSIVLMDFSGSKDNWINAAKLGAKAVVFIGEGDRYDAIKKSLWIPLDFPRIFVPEPDGSMLKEAINETVRVLYNMRFEQRTAKNVIGFIYGKKMPEQSLILTAYYDSYSITPSFAPGAQESLGISTLLELARFFSEYSKRERGPDRTIMFVAFAGHNQALLGAREFTELFLFERRWQSKVGLMDMTYFPILINLDLATDNDWVVNLGAGDVCALGYGTRGPAFQAVRWIYDRFKDVYTPQIIDAWKTVYGRAFRIDLDPYYPGSRAPEPNHIVMDSEPYLAAGANGFSFYTAYSERKYYSTPFDTYDRLLWNNLQPQIETIFSAIYMLQAEPQLKELSTEVTRIGGRLYGANYGKLFGRVVTFNPSINQYEGVSKALVAIQGPGLYRYILTTDEDGLFTVVGITAFGTNYGIYPFYLDENGTIEYAPDFGIYSFGNDVQITIWRGGIIGTQEYPQYFTIFKCGSVAFFDLLAPRTGFASSVFRIMDFNTHSTPAHYSFFPREASPIVVAFLEPGTRVEAIAFQADVPIPSAIILNSSRIRPQGNGYEVKYGRQLLVTNALLKNAEDMWLLNNERINTFLQFNVFEPAANQLHDVAKLILDASRDAFENRSYGLALTNAQRALGVETRAYARILSLYNETISSTMFFFALLVPFVFLAERLFLSWNGPRRLLGIIMIFIMAIGTFALFHAGFHLGANMLIVLIGFVTMALTLPLVPILGGHAQSRILEWRRAVVGLHFAEISRTGAILLSLSYGVQQMRKRRLRTTLTFTSILMIALALVSMTSMSVHSITLQLPTGGEPTRVGLLVAAWIDPFRGIQPISEELLEGIRRVYSEGVSIAPRAWLYNIHTGNMPGDFNDPYARGLLNISSGDSWRTAAAILGISENELNIAYQGDIQRIEQILLDGVWFPSEDELFVLISKDYADYLNISMSDPSSTLIRVNGIQMRVCGIFDAKLLESIKELDGRPIMPFDPSDWRKRQPLRGYEVLLMPFNAVMRRLATWGPFITQVALDIENPVKVKELAESITLYYDFDVYASTGERVYLFAHGVSREVSGLTFIILPSIIGVLSLFNIMLGNVIERRREISTFASVGLSPLHVGSIFLTEAGIYAILGGTLGYLFGIIIASGAYRFYGVAVNYSSIMVVAVVLLSMGLTTSSAIYPIYKCARLVTPSLERKWKVPTKPKGDTWEIPLPFVSSEDEAKGIIAFMKEFYEGHMIRDESPVFFAQNLSIEERATNNITVKSLIATVAIEPYPRGISQRVIFNASITEGRASYTLFLKRLTGEQSSWQHLNKSFISEVRRQLLIWRSLRDHEKKRYMETKL